MRPCAAGPGKPRRLFPARGLFSGWLRLLTLALLLMAGGNLAAAPEANLDELRVERRDDGLRLYAQLRFQPSKSVQAALREGIAIYYLARARVVHKRWYWSDRTLADARRYLRIAYQPLMRRWALSSSTQPFGSPAVGTGLIAHYYGSQDEAFRALRSIAGWQIASAEQLAGADAQRVEFSFRIDTERLPRTLRLGAIGGSDWQLSLSQTVDLDVEPLR